MRYKIVFLLILAGAAHAGTITPKDAINLAAKELAAEAAKKAQKAATSAETSAASAAVEVDATKDSLEQWRAAIKEVTEANAKRATDDQETNQQYAFWGIVVNAFGVLFMGVLVGLWRRIRAEVANLVANLPEVVKQLGLIGPVMQKLETNTNSLVATAEEAAKERGIKEGIAQEKERAE